MPNDVLSRSAREARNEYQRKWRAEHKENVRASNQRYWNRRAERIAAEREIEKNAEDADNRQGL